MATMAVGSRQILFSDAPAQSAPSSAIDSSLNVNNLADNQTDLRTEVVNAPQTQVATGEGGASRVEGVGEQIDVRA